MPVIVIALLSITKTYNDPTKQVYVWIAVFVLPINSSINPFLYTFSTLRKKKKSTETSGQDKKQQAKSNTSTTVDNKTDDTVIKQQEMKPPVKVKYHIQLIEDFSGPKSGDGIGFVLADVESNGSFECCLIKYFSQDRKKLWEKEVKILSLIETMDGDGGECVAKQRWNCLANEYTSGGKGGKDVKIVENAALICFEYVPNKSLNDFLDDKDELTFDNVCSFGIDIISAIGFLQTCGISNNNINPKTIAVHEAETKGGSVKAVLVDFSKATELRVYENGSYIRSDIIQFSCVFKRLLKNCKEFTEYKQVKDVFSLCDKERSKSTAIAIKTLLLEARMISKQDSHLCEV